MYRTLCIGVLLGLVGCGVASTDGGATTNQSENIADQTITSAVSPVSTPVSAPVTSPLRSPVQVERGAAGSIPSGAPDNRVAVQPTSGSSSSPVDVEAALRERRLNEAGSLETAASLGEMSSLAPGSSANPRMRLRGTPVSGQPGLYEVTLNNTGSGWQEKFLFQIPLTGTSTPAPMIVVFHKFGVSHWDAFYNTSFIAEARARGWYVLAPLGASGVNFGSLESQINTRAALDLVTSLYNVDKTRVYGVGFSMGGGSAVSYAARNLDPDRVMFAALCNHTGGVSLTHTYLTQTDDNDADDNIPEFGANLEVRDILDYWFGGPPWMYTFNYLRAQAFDLNPFNGVIDPTTDMSLNISHVPTLVWLADGDPSLELFSETIKFSSQVQPRNSNNQLKIVPSNYHSWITLEEAQVCDYFAQRSLQLPKSAKTLADESGTFFHFQIEQTEPLHFSPFTWSVDSIQNRLDLSATANITRISVNCGSAGLEVTHPLTISLSTADGTGDELLLLGITSPPSSVLRDGASANAVFNPTTHTLLITEFDSAAHEWVVTP